MTFLLLALLSHDEYAIREYATKAVSKEQYVPHLKLLLKSDNPEVRHRVYPIVRKFETRKELNYLTSDPENFYRNWLDNKCQERWLSTGKIIESIYCNPKNSQLFRAICNEYGMSSPGRWCVPGPWYDVDEYSYRDFLTRLK